MSYSKIKQALFEENQRFMALHGHVWDPKKDGDGLGGTSSSSSTTKTSIEQMMESLDGGGGVDSAGGVAIVRPGDASK
jgi:hypothetical protein